MRIVAVYVPGSGGGCASSVSGTCPPDAIVPERGDTSSHGPPVSSTVNAAGPQNALNTGKNDRMPGSTRTSPPTCTERLATQVVAVGVGVAAAVGEADGVGEGTGGVGVAVGTAVTVAVGLRGGETVVLAIAVTATVLGTMAVAVRVLVALPVTLCVAVPPPPGLRVVVAETANAGAVPGMLVVPEAA